MLNFLFEGVGVLFWAVIGLMRDRSAVSFVFSVFSDSSLAAKRAGLAE